MDRSITNARSRLRRPQTPSCLLPGRRQASFRPAWLAQVSSGPIANRTWRPRLRCRRQLPRRQAARTRPSTPPVPGGSNCRHGALSSSGTSGPGLHLLAPAPAPQAPNVTPRRKARTPPQHRARPRVGRALEPRRYRDAGECPAAGADVNDRPRRRAPHGCAATAPKARPARPREARLAPAHPSRHWVQIAGGANRATLPREFARLKTLAPAQLGQRTAYVTSLRATNRLLVGPFATTTAAQSFVNQLAGRDIQAFAWTSPAGQEIERLQTSR